MIQLTSVSTIALPSGATRTRVSVSGTCFMQTTIFMSCL
jgi:hypothetical protein